ncbi:Acyl-CoA synthetase short-chain family member 3, mitochondrial [Smittium mucronatum]|uniref:Acyl-CoA synthetase short-chain family member 3, mitochondrial n=1 Tax=Smittium mucronatum TaxID=133383 RepID=A0A1R0H8U9_9FUNG|nr:Acyl-CoA synthetase short-chain family member 3, mitochondrial [Smittium mucronatum]
MTTPVAPKFKYKQQQVTKLSLDNPDTFWLNQAKLLISWHKAPTIALHYKDPTAKHFVDWFPDGKLNVCYNALDRHVIDGHGDQTALIYDSPVTFTKKLFTYSALLDNVKAFTKVLAKYGIKKGDTVVVYMPMIPETIVAMLSIVRLGAIHSVVFGGFAPKELAKRIDDCKPKLVLSATCGIEGPNKLIHYKPLLDEAISIAKYPSNHQIIFQRPQLSSILNPSSGDVDWVEALSQSANSPDVPIEILDSSDPMYLLYTSGTTGAPKGVVRSSGPHAVQLVYAMRYVYGLSPSQTLFASSDLGWQVGHSLTCYGALLNRNKTVLYEGKPVGTPDPGAFFRVISEYNVNVFFTAPTALMILRREDSDAKYRNKYDLSSCKAFFLAGERCVPEIHKWWIQYITRNHNLDKHTLPPDNSNNSGGGGNGDRFNFSSFGTNTCVSSDHWWQTESGAPLTALGLGYCHSVSEYPEIRFGSAGLPLPGVDMKIVSKKPPTHHHQKNSPNSKPEILFANPYEVGSVVLKLPLPPGNLTTLWNNDSRFYNEYFKMFPGYYSTGDTGYIDKDGYVFILSRDDDVINISAHRMSTSVVEEVAIEHPQIAECCVVPRSHEIKGQVPMVFAVPKSAISGSDLSKISSEIVHSVKSKVGAFASLYQNNVVFINKLPKTRSGKVLRKLIRNMVSAIDSSPEINPNSIAVEIPPTIDDEHFALDIWRILCLNKSKSHL